MRDKKLNKYVKRLKELCNNDFDDYIFANYILPDLEKIINILLKDKDSSINITYAYSELFAEERRNFLYYLLSSDIDIFTEWYLECLLRSMVSSDVVESEAAKDIYKLYERSFETVVGDCIFPSVYTSSFKYQEEQELTKYLNALKDFKVKYIMKKKEKHSIFAYIEIYGLYDKTGRTETFALTDRFPVKDKYTSLLPNKKYTPQELRNLGLRID